MKILKILFLLANFVCVNSFAQTLKPIFEDYNVYDSNTDEFLDKRISINYEEGVLSYNNHIVFKHIDSYAYCMYEVFNSRFLIVSSLSKKNYHNNLRYALPKSKITIFDLEDLNKGYELDLKNKYIVDIYYSSSYNAESDDLQLVVDVTDSFDRILIKTK